MLRYLDSYSGSYGFIFNNASITALNIPRGYEPKHKNFQNVNILKYRLKQRAFFILDSKSILSKESPTLYTQS